MSASAIALEKDRLIDSEFNCGGTVGLLDQLGRGLWSPMAFMPSLLAEVDDVNDCIISNQCAWLRERLIRVQSAIYSRARAGCACKFSAEVGDAEHVLFLWSWVMGVGLSQDWFF